MTMFENDTVIVSM